MPFAALLALLLFALPAAAQDAVPPAAYRDAAARELVRLARARREIVDTRISAYTTTAHERLTARMGVAGVERLLLRRETVSRIAWTRDTVRIELVAAREAQPVIFPGVQLPPPDIAGFLPGIAFDPVDPEILFRFDFLSLRHPLAADGEQYYRFASGDSSAIRLPDGRTVRLVELRVTARRPEPQLIHGSFWLEAETHAVVRTAFRLSRAISTAGPGIHALAPEAEAELDHVVIDYGLWDLRWWLPRTMSVRGVIRAAGVRFPLAYERRYDGYRVVGDTTAAPLEASSPDLPAQALCRPPVFGSVTINVGAPRTQTVRDSVWDAAWDRSATRVLRGDTAPASDRPRCERPFVVTPASAEELLSGAEFAGDLFDEDAGPLGDAEMRELAGLLRGIPSSPWGLARPAVQVLTPELVRFNRVEGLSLGARAVLPLGRIDVQGEVRAGTTGEVGARLAVVHALPSLRTESAVYRGLEAVEWSSQPFGLTNSLSALVLGRDENDYFRGTGAEVRLGPAPSRRQAWDIRLFAERQEPVETRAAWSLRGVLDDDFTARDNLAAERIDQAGATLRLRAAHGDDPARLRLDSELALHAETGDRGFVRPSLRLGASRHIGAGFGLATTLAAGAGLGDVPVQRAWQIGGSATVRGHDPASLRGESLWLARTEVSWGSPAVGLALFGDAGWAGARPDLGSARPLLGAGLGVSLLDDLFRLDLARGLNGGGFRAYLRVGAGR
jgi:hypothetical protein